MGKKITWLDTSSEDFRKWFDLCPPNHYRIIPPNSLSSVIPNEILRNADSVLLVSSGSPEGQIVYMANIHRLEQNNHAVDQEPFGILFKSTDPSSGGCLIHHGKWSQRTAIPPSSFWNAVENSGIGNCVPFSELPPNDFGPVSELSIKSQNDAFMKIIRSMKNKSMLCDD
jgi:hypothetical protein